MSAGRIALPRKRKKDFVHKALQESDTWIKSATATPLAEKEQTAQWCRIFGATDAERLMFLDMLNIRVTS